MDRDLGSIVFLSHNSADKPAVEAVMHRLDAFTPPIRCWLDKDDLRAQGTWMQQIEDVIETCEAAAVFYGPHGFGRVHDGERQLLLDRAMRQSETFRLIPILLPGAHKSDVVGFAKLHNWVDFSAGLDSPAAMERLVAFIRGEAPRETLADDELPDNVEPYRGLERFDSQHSEFYFGRDREIGELCQCVKKWPFVAVIGGSGSGKSSLVRAGLQTQLALRELPSLQNATVIAVLPGSNPMRALADQLAGPEQMEAGQPPEAVADAYERRFRERSDGLLTLLTSRFPRDNQFILLHVDQFEELFTHSLNPHEAPGHYRDQASQFVALLDAVASSRQDRLRIVITLRADFFDRCLEIPKLVPLVQNHQLLLGELSREALHDVIVRPGKQAGAFFEKGLAARIQADVQHEHGSLPLLQHALKELWARRLGRWLTNEGYDETGGVAGALRKRADETLRGFTSSQREIAKRLFLRLTTLGEGVSDTRRRVKLAEMYPADAAARADVENVVDKLSGKAARLIVTNDDGTAEVTHESLIQQWDELRNWLDANRDQKRLQDRLRDAAQEWWETCHDDYQRRDTSYLWDGGRLEDAEEFAREQTGALNELEQAFLEASIKKRDHENRVQTRRSVLVTALVIAGAFAAYVAIQQITIARTQQAEAQKQAESAVLGGYNSGIANVEAIWRSDRRAAQRALTNGELFPIDLRDFTWHYLNRLANHSPIEYGPRLHPDNLDLIAAAPTADVRLAWIDRDGQLWLWLPEERDDPQHLVDAGKAKFLTFSSDGERLLWSRGDGQVEFFDTTISQGGIIASNAFLNSATAFSVSANGDHLLFAEDAKILKDPATGDVGDGAIVHQMDLSDGSAKEVLQLETGGASVTRLAQSEDGKVIVATHRDHFTVVRIASPIEMEKFEGACHLLSPAGNYVLMTLARDSRVPIFFAVRGAELSPVAVLKVDDLGGLRVAAFSPDGSKLAVASNHLDLPGEISLYESETGKLLSRSIGELYENGKEDFEAIRFAGRGRILFSWGRITNAGGSDAGYLKLRDTVTGGQVINEVPSWAVSSQVMQSEHNFPQPGNVSFTAERIEIHTGSGSNQSKSIPVLSGTTPTAVALSPDNIWVAYVGVRDGKHFAAIRRTIESDGWKILSGKGKVSEGIALAFSPKNHWLAVAGSADSVANRHLAGAIDLWKYPYTDATEPNVVILAEPGPVNAVCFTPDERTLATGSDGPGYGERGGYNGMVRLWDPVTGQQRISLPGHQWHVHDVAFSPDGLQLASLSSRGLREKPEMLLWDAREWKLQQAKKP